MQGTAGTPGDPQAKDPIDRASSRVQAVACFCPPTDFLNYGEEGRIALGRGVLEGFKPAFDFVTFDPAGASFGAFVPITDEDKVRDIGRQISPITHVTADDPPTLIIHGDADLLVPFQQAETIIAKFKEMKVPARLIVKHGAGHGWAGREKDMELIADWFDEHLEPRR
jgi:fermentation-respiration switch protein FrsA (DUF1100 family)